jgi:hypothetical protein
MSQIEKDLKEMWETFQCVPDHVEMPLENFRKYFADRADLRPDVVTFLSETKDVNPQVIVVLTPGTVTLLTDDEGNLLEFK